MQIYSFLFFNPLKNKILYAGVATMGNGIETSELLYSAVFYHLHNLRNR